MTLHKDSLAYGSDLAYIHDVGFSQFATTAAKGLLQTLRRHGWTKGRVVELGSGSGTLATILLAHGYSVHGIDLSPAMVDLARTKAPAGTFMIGSFWTAPIPKCDVVLSVGECINYEFKGTNTPRRLKKLFSSVYDALSPQGIFVFDMLCERNSPEFVHTHGYREGPGWGVAVERTERGNLIIRRITSFLQDGSLYHKSVEVHLQRRHSLPVVQNLLKNLGFRIETRRGYSGKPLGDEHVVVLAYKGPS